MFTTLTLVKKERTTPKEKLRLVRGRRFCSVRHYYAGTEFYTTQLQTFHRKNAAAAEKFKRKCGMRVISEASPEVRDYRYLLTVNSYLRTVKIFPDAVLFDPTGELCFLLPRLLSACRTVWVCSKAEEKYEAENTRIYGLLGAAAIVSSQLPMHTPDAVISAVPLVMKGAHILGEQGIFADGNSFVMPQPIAKETGCGDLYTAAGLYAAGHVKYLSTAFCNNFTYCGNVFRWDDFFRV